MKHSMEFLIFVLTLQFTLVKSVAQPCLNDSMLIPIDSTIKIGVLPNGLTYYLKHNNWPENRVCFYLAQKVGSLQETDEQRGLAHFLEHMCFNGSEHFKGNGIERFCESLGISSGDANAFTSIEKTVYYMDDVPTMIGPTGLHLILLKSRQRGVWCMKNGGRIGMPLPEYTKDNSPFCIPTRNTGKGYPLA